MSYSDEKTTVGVSQGFTRRRFLAESRSALVATGLASTGIAGSLLAACGGSQITTSSGPVEVTYTYPTFGKVSDVQLVADAMNATAQFKQANIRVKLNPIDQASYSQKMTLGYTAGTRYDLLFTAPWTNIYSQNASNGNFLALDDLLPQKAPKLYGLMPAKYWDTTRIKGKIYGIPNNTFFAGMYGVFLNPDLAQKYAQYIPATVTSYADMEPFLAQVKANEPDVTPVYMADSGVAAGDVWQGGTSSDFDTFNQLTGIRYNDTQLQILNIYDTPEFALLARMRWRWTQAGYTKKDQVIGSTGKFDVQSGKYAMLLGQQCKPSDIPSVNAYYGLKFVVKPVTPRFMGTGAILGFLNAVGRSSAHPVEALKLSELINTDPVIFNLLCHGIEGKHYVFVDKAKKLIDFPKGVTADTSGYYPNSDWEFGNQANDYYTDPNAVGVYDQIQQANASAPLSAAFGFTIDESNLKTEITQVGSVVGPLVTALNTGRLNPADLPNHISQMKQAGAPTIVAEIQRQINAWAASKK